ncbi:P-loop NTPase fold protein [Amycolatopsis carbonis]|uniref:P-loop NTPase fold protein n=1 Tax=Amycolatopsis carbonis TaxID=715471 RepID=A0A9Y2MYK3_9PSEU|nr:P-loop NTPase fold protein [Amycolatopsis sp. 2-15]WIX81728.1 P-loop NTPase fold protein [Amycolatopsis sp. 2-15]
MAEEPELGYLGTAGAVSCYLARTERPWEADIDAIVISVGGTLGTLGHAVSRELPDADWETIGFDTITPELPQVLDIRNGGLESLRFALLATPHDGGSFQDPTLPAIAVATESVVRKAADVGAVALGLPLLGSGSLGFEPGAVADEAIPAAVKALPGVDGGSLQRLVFLCRDRATEDAILAAWNGETSAADLAGGVSSDRVDPTVGIPLERDRLGVAPYVSMMATVISDRSTPLPLSVGVFGEWGSGKSYSWGCCGKRSVGWQAPATPPTCMRLSRSASTPGTTPMPTCGPASATRSFAGSQGPARVRRNAA